MFGHRVTVLEGHGRPGGRVYTRRLEVSMPAQERTSLCDFATLVPLTIQLRQLSVQPMRLIQVCICITCASALYWHRGNCFLSLLA